MIAKNLISRTIPPLKPSDTGRKAMQWMSELHLQHLPVLKDGEYVGIISEYEILDANDADSTLHDFQFTHNRPFVREYDHIFDVLKATNRHRLSVMPVLDNNDKYKGLITMSNLVDFFAATNSMTEPGGIIVLSMKQYDYALSEIARIVESNDARILSLYVSSFPEMGSIEVTLKVNRSDLAGIISTLERYEYQIKASYQETNYLDDAKNRIDELFNYLDI